MRCFAMFLVQKKWMPVFLINIFIEKTLNFHKLLDNADELYIKKSSVTNRNWSHLAWACFPIYLYLKLFLCMEKAILVHD